ncbi:MAG: hypothetical protein ABI221_00120 [Candidatus Saccharimonadales bacterium]
MKITRNIVIIFAGVVSLMAVMAGGLAWSLHSLAPTSRRSVGATATSLEAINKQCRDRIGQDGFGTVTISGVVSLRNQNGRLSTDCRLQLLPGAQLRLIDSRLETGKLLISDQASSELPSSILIDRSKLSGDGFQVRLKAAGSSAIVQDSQLNFRLSLGLSLGAGDQDQRASLVVMGSKLQSDESASQGIILVSTGRGTFKNTQFLAPLGDSALLLAPKCQSNQNRGPITACGGT